MNKILVFLSIALFTACNGEGIVRITPEFETYSLIKAKGSPKLKKEGVYAYIKEYSNGQTELRFRVQHVYVHNNWNDVYFDRIKYLINDTLIIKTLDEKHNDMLYFGFFKDVQWNDDIADEELIKQIIGARTAKIKYRRENPETVDTHQITERERRNIELIYKFYKEYCD